MNKTNLISQKRIFLLLNKDVKELVKSECIPSDEKRLKLKLKRKWKKLK